ncbi:MAG: hypothetical protein D9V47_04880 [Clostridia bacterium]|nr:MAG: hypothetical protein D9V47_04880 [Clostridia bacterium]
MAVPEEARKETAAGAEGGGSWFSGSFDPIGYIFQRLDHLEAMIRQVETNLRQEIKQSEARTEEKFNRVDENFSRVYEKFDRVDEKFDRVDAKLEQLNGRLHNLTLWAIGALFTMIVGFIAILIPLLRLN